MEFGYQLAAFLVFIGLLGTLFPEEAQRSAATIARARRQTKIFSSPVGERIAASPHYVTAVRISGVVMLIAGLTIAGSLLTR